MPEIRYFTVTQTREVQVTANSATDALRLAGVAFDKGQASDGAVRSIDYTEDMKDIWGNTTSRIREKELVVKER